MSARPPLIRLLAPFIALMVAIVMCGLMLVWWAGRRATRIEQLATLDRVTSIVRRQSFDELTDLSPAQRAEIERLSMALGARITLITATGRVLADTHGDASTMDNHNTRPEVIEARRMGIGSSVRGSDTTREERFYLAQLLERNQPEGMVVRLGYLRASGAGPSLPIVTILLGGAGVAAVAAGILLRLQHQRWIGPARHLAEAADRMSAGEWQTRVQPGGSDELRSLGARFNIVAAQAQQQLADLRHQRADLRALVDALPDSVLLGDAQDRIVLINTPAAELLQLTPGQALGRKMDVVVNEEPILRVLEDAKKGIPITRDIRLTRSGQRLIYQAVATVSQAGGVLLVLRNISALAVAVQMKTDFVANASHELRTPIAAIKMAFETLQEVINDDPRQTGKCITIIEGHLRRLEEMLGDLLDLSRVESPDLQPQITSIRIEDLFSFVRSSVGSMASLKGVEIETETSDPASEFTGDRHLLELVMKNLVENSVKFTPAGGKVTVSFFTTGEQIVLEVVDTGIGIPPEHQERVFERFYQVDPARSGSAGRGTGLGLAIVKHAVHALGGTVKLTSAAGVGTKVRCTIPQAETSQNIQPVT